MGGFELYDSNGERPLYPLDLKNIEKLVESGDIDFPNITEKEIEDRSKGDIISKGLAIIQTGWFIMQCIARGAAHLAITELEIMTVAFAVLNLITYVFWWNKPLNVACPVRIVLKEGHRAPEPRSPKILSFSDRIERMLSLVNPGRDHNVNLLRETRVSTFYSGEIQERGKSFFALYFAEMIIAMVFGGIHCIAWSFSFPTHVERILWRASSIAIISTPFLVLVFILVFAFLGLNISDFFDFFGHLLAIFLPCIYVFSRLILMVLSFISLRSLPPNAFYTVHWTTFIPHVG
jgi:hypothetical protein